MKSLCLIGALTLTLICCAQSAKKEVHLRVLDGRNGSPVANETVSLWYDERDGAAMVVTTNDKGMAVLPPALQDPLRIILQPMQSIDCRKQQEEPVFYSLRTIAEFGMMAQNTCGHPVVRKQSGEIVLFVRGRRWSDGFNQ